MVEHDCAEGVEVVPAEVEAENVSEETTVSDDGDNSKGGSGIAAIALVIALVALICSISTALYIMPKLGSVDTNKDKVQVVDDTSNAVVVDDSEGEDVVFDDKSGVGEDGLIYDANGDEITAKMPISLISGDGATPSVYEMEGDYSDIAGDIQNSIDRVLHVYPTTGNYDSKRIDITYYSSKLIKNPTYASGGSITDDGFYLDEDGRYIIASSFIPRGCIVQFPGLGEAMVYDSYPIDTKVNSKGEDVTPHGFYFYVNW